jgi:hypothetical protein
MGTQLHFVPSRVEGLPDVTEAVIRPDQLELCSGGRWMIFRFTDIAEWPRPIWYWRLRYRLGFPPSWLPVADRDWFHAPPERFFRFFTDPTIIVYMPVDEPREHSLSNFYRVQEVLRVGGFATFDLG